MAKKNKIGLQIDLEPYITALENANSSAESAVESVLKASKKVTTDALIRDTVNGNFPAKGKYSTGDLVKSIERRYSVDWAGATASIDVGYNMKKSGLTSIMLLYGTPRMKKASKLYNDIYGSRIKKQIKEIQQEALDKILERVVRDSGR